MRFPLLTIVLTAIASLVVAFHPESLFAGLFVSVDYFFVMLLAACPLALFVNQIIPAEFRRYARSILPAVGLIAIPALSLTTANRFFADQTMVSLLVCRLGASLLIAGPWMALLQERLFSSSNGQSRHEPAEPDQNTLLQHAMIGMLAAVVIPYAYLQFLVDYHETKLGEAMRKDRIERARTIAEEWFLLQPHAVWNSRELASLLTELTRQTGYVRMQLQRAPAPTGTRRDGQIIQAYMRLDDYGGAMRYLRPLLEQPETAALAWDTYGLLLQRQEKWTESRKAYERALQEWQETDGEQVSSGMASAYRGIAYAQNQQGQKRDAHETYQQLIELVPTAENHFLLAQFYEEAQQTDRALTHAEKAATLAPQQYLAQSEQLIHKMQSAHFGCFRVYSRGE